MKNTRKIPRLVSVVLITIWSVFLLLALNSKGVTASNQTQLLLDDFLFDEGGIGIGHVFCSDHACITDHYPQHRDSSALHELEKSLDSGTVLLEEYLQFSNTQENDDFSIKIALMDMLDERIYLSKLSFSQLLQLKDRALQEHYYAGRLVASTTFEIALRMFIVVGVSFILIGFAIYSFLPFKKRYKTVEL